MLLTLFLTCFIAPTAATLLRWRSAIGCGSRPGSWGSPPGSSSLSGPSRPPRACGGWSRGRCWRALLVASVFIFVANVLVDLGFALLDPRVRPS